MRSVVTEKINVVVHVCSTYFYTNGKVEHTGLVPLIRDERGGCVDEKGFCYIVSSS
jgi:hypothetical protein